jgi:hypothetical protein
MVGISTTSYSQISLYKEINDGMDKSTALSIYKKNKTEYKEINLGNGFVYTINRMGGIGVDENDKVRTITMWPKGTALSGLGWQGTVNYLNHTRSFFEQKGYEILLENPYWNAPLNFNASGYVYGLVMVNSDGDKVVHIFPVEMMLMESKIYNSYIVLTTKDYWDKSMNKRKEKFVSETTNTDF